MRVKVMKTIRYVLKQLETCGAVEICLRDFNMNLSEGYRVCAALETRGYKVTSNLYTKHITVGSGSDGIPVRVLPSTALRDELFSV